MGKCTYLSHKRRRFEKDERHLRPTPINQKKRRKNPNLIPHLTQKHAIFLSLSSKKMENLWRAATGQDPNPDDYKGVEFWTNPERAGWLTKQGDYIKTWRRRWFILKQGKLLWFKDPASVSRRSSPRGVVSVGSCLTVKGAEDIVNKAFAFELSTRDSTMYFIADTEKEKEDWINSIGRSIVQHSRSVTDSEIVDYDSKSR